MHIDTQACTEYEHCTETPADTCHICHMYTHMCIPPTQTHTQDPMLPAHMWAQRSRLTNPRARPVWLAWRLGPRERREEQMFLAAEGHPKVKIAQLGLPGGVLGSAAALMSQHPHLSRL